jgi:hypothetical protein
MAGTLTVEALQPVKVRFKSDGSRYDLQPANRLPSRSLTPSSCSSSRRSWCDLCRPTL